MKNPYKPMLYASLVMLTLCGLPTQVAADGKGTETQRAVLVSAGSSVQSGDSTVNRLTGLGYTGTVYGKDEQADSVSLGYRHPLKAKWSLDTQYLVQGKSNPILQVTPLAGKTDAQTAQDVAESLPERGNGVSVAGIYHHPLSGKWVAQTGLGAFLWQSERTATVNATRYTRKNDGINPVLQAGLSYQITPKVLLEGSIQHFFMPDEAIDRVAVGVAIGF